MPSLIYDIVVKERDPISVLTAVYELIVTAERNYSLPMQAQNIFDKKMNCTGRTWGFNSMSIDDIDISRGLDQGFWLNCSEEEYSRGCFMGTSTHRFFIPDELVELYEKWQDEDGGCGTSVEGHFVHFDAFHVALEKFTKERAASAIEEYDRWYSDQQAIGRAAQEQNEANERDLLEKLKAKYES